MARGKSARTEFRNNLRTIETNTCTWQEINYVGGQLWLGLTPDELRQGLRVATRRRHHRPGLSDSTPRCPDECRSYPWESLYDRNISLLGRAEKPRYGIVHHPPAEAHIAAYEPREGTSLSMLILAPENTQLDVSREIGALTRDRAQARHPAGRATRTGHRGQDLQDACVNSRWDICPLCRARRGQRAESPGHRAERRRRLRAFGKMPETFARASKPQRCVSRFSIAAVAMAITTTPTS